MSRRAAFAARRSTDAAVETTTAIPEARTPNAERQTPTTEQWPTVDRRTPPLLACAGIETPRLFGDDILTVCALCSAAIYHRPGALAELGPGARAACLPCAARHEEHTRPGDGPRTAGMTAGTLRAATRYLSEHRR